MSSNTWKSQSGYIWSLIGSAVGFANILSFSAQVYRNGGGAFLIPYCLALFLLGIPFLLLEGLVGNRWKAPLVTAYGQAAGSMGRTLGWLAVLACFSIGAFYVVLTGYSVAYTYFSAAAIIPEDTKSFFLNDFLKITPSIAQFGELSWAIFTATLSVLVLTWYVLSRNVRDGIERICTLFMPLLAVMMCLFAVAACLLPGGMNGVIYYFRPDFSRLLDPTLWRDVFGQLFFSLSLGLGIIVGYSRHTASNTNISRAMLWVVIGDSAVSFIAGLAIFGCLAHISYIQNIPFESILTTDSTFEIGFILFPQILKFFGTHLSQLLGTLFFSCVFIAGITGVFSIVESIAGNVEVEFKLTRKRAVSYTILALIVVSTCFCMGNASHLIDALAPMVIGTNMLIGGLGLVYAFQYRSYELKHASLWWNGTRLNLYGFSLRYVAPVILSVILMGTIWQELQSFEMANIIRWGWLIIGALLSAFLAKLSKRLVSVNVC